MKKILLASTVLFAASSAYAADAVVYQEAAVVEVADTFSWTGGYIGLNAGYAGGRAKTNVDTYEDGIYDGGGSLKDNASGFIGGIQAGYNWQYDQTIVGIETDIQASGVEAKFDFDDFTVAKTKINWFGTTRVRLGYTPVDRFMVYATGGVAYGQIKHEMFDSELSGKDTRVGYTVGAGAEYAISNNWTFKTEYLYTDLGKLKLSYNEASEDGDIGANTSTKLGFHTVRVGVNYKF